MIHYLNMVMVSPIKTRHMEKLLLVDIGGTNMRHAVITDKSNEISNISKSPFIGNTFDIQLEELLKKDDIKTLIISVAGPKIKNTITMTNRDYTFDANKIKEKFSLKNCYLLNDWEAIAHSYSFISNSIESLKQGKSFNNNILFLGPGTGLGAALSIDNKIVIPTEIGNTSNSSSRLHQNYNIEIEKDKELSHFISRRESVDFPAPDGDERMINKPRRLLFDILYLLSHLINRHLHFNTNCRQFF